MIAITWNVRGLGARIKRNMLRRIILNHSPFFIFIQETKLESLNPKMQLAIWKNGSAQWLLSPSVGNSGGLITMWDESYFDLISSRVDRNWIAIIGNIKALDFKCLLINIYSPCAVDERAETWRKLVQLREEFNLPCIVMGDFNEVLSSLDRGSQFVSTNGSKAFHSFLQAMSLIEIPLDNGWYTWHRGKSKSKIDRIFVSQEWITKLPSLSASTLKRNVSDHTPLILKTGAKNWGPRPFRFQNEWLSHPGCIKLIQATWEDSTCSTLTGKLK